MLREAQIAFTNITIIRNESFNIEITFIGGKMKRTKIVCTVGPGTDKFGILEDMMRAGMNVARFNFSHGTHEVPLRGSLHFRRTERLMIT